MPVELGPFSVAPEQIARLSDSFTSFINKLLDVETAVAGMSGVTLMTTYRVNLADGGVDAGLRRAIETRWLPAGDSAWQFKAGDRSPQKCADELKDAAEALAVLRSGGKYRLVIGEGLTAQKIRNRREALITQAEESLHTTIDSNGDVIEVLDANSLARWIQEHPYIAVSPMLGGIDTVALSFESWAASNRNDSIWVPSDSRNQLKQQIEDFVRGNGQVDLRIEGVSGLGKSRAVLESLRGTQQEPLVLYVHAADDLAPGLIPRLLNQNRVGIVIIDDCSGKKHEELAGLVPSESRLRLITIGEPDAYEVQSSSIRLAPLDTSIIDEVLVKNQPSLWPEARRVVVAQCAGNVRWALQLAKGILRQHPGTAAELLTRDAIRTYVTNSLPSGVDLLACSALALFTRVGYDAELAGELQTVADLLDFEPTQLRAAAHALAKAGLLDKQGRYRSVAPHPLAVYLAAVAWEAFSDRLIRLLPDMPPELAERLLRRAADVGRSDGTSMIVERILAPGGPFSTLSDLASAHNSRLLVEAAIISPDEVTRHLAELLGASSFDELAAAIEIRRNLVWTLQKLVWHRRTFVDAADCLLWLAIAENEEYANNATGTWVSLFGAMLPGTAARPSERVAYLRQIAKNGNHMVRFMVVLACARALSPHESITVFGEVQGGVFVEPRGGPETYGELWDYQRDMVTLARELVDDEDSEVSQRVVKVLKGVIHPFLAYERVRDTLFDALTSLPPEALEQVWAEINQLRNLFRRVPDLEDRAAGLDILVTRLPQPTPRETLSVLVHANRWEFDEGELQRRLSAEARALPPAGAVQRLLSYLDDSQLPAAYEAGHALYDLAAGTDTLMSLADKVVMGAGIAALTGYLWAAVEEGEANAFDEYLDGDNGAALADATRLSLTVRGPRSDDGWARVLQLNERLPVHQAAPLLFGWHTNVEIERLVALLDCWLSQISTQVDYNAAVDFMAMALYGRADRIPELDPLISDLVQGFGGYPTTGQKSWDWAKLAKRVIDYAPDRLLRTLLDLIDRGALFVHAGGEEAAVLQELAGKMGSEGLKSVLDRVAAGSWRIQMDVRGWLLANFAPEIVIAWIGNDLSRARVVASVAGVPKAGQPNDMVRHLLDRFGNDDAVASALAGEYTSGSWFGPTSSHLTEQIEHLSSWLGAPEPEGVKRWAKQIISSLKARRRMFVQYEAEEEH